VDFVGQNPTGSIIGTQTGMLMYHHTQIFFEFLREFLKGGIFLFPGLFYLHSNGELSLCAIDAHVNS